MRTFLLLLIVPFLILIDTSNPKNLDFRSNWVAHTPLWRWQSCRLTVTAATNRFGYNPRPCLLCRVRNYHFREQSREYDLFLLIELPVACFYNTVTGTSPDDFLT